MLRGIDYILSKQHADGYWADYDIPGPGKSDIWVTAMTSWLLRDSSKVPKNREVEIALSKSGDWLFRIVLQKGCGYNSDAPEDADTTAWVIRYFAASEFPISKSFDLGYFQKEDGGFCTYVEKFYGDWSKSCPDVTANACAAVLSTQAPILLGIAGLEKPIAYLLNHQQADGHWNAYWWNSPYYSTCLVTEVLASSNDYSNNVELALQFIIDEQNADGGWGIDGSNAIDTSLCLTLLQKMKLHLTFRKHVNTSAISKALRWLIDHQCSDGSWKPSKLLLVPPFFQANNIGQMPVYCDRERIVSTAFAVYALSVTLR